MKDSQNILEDVILELRMIQIHLFQAKKSTKTTSRGIPVQVIERIEHSLTSLTQLIEHISWVNRQ